MGEDGKAVGSPREFGDGMAQPTGRNLSKLLQLRLLWIASTLLLGLLLLGALADAYIRPLPGSTGDDEVRTPAAQRAFFDRWQGALADLQKGRLGFWALPSSTEKFGWWDRLRKLPNEATVRLVLRRHLAPDIDLRELQPVHREALADGVSVCYLVTVEPRSAEYLVPIEPAGIPAGTGKIEAGLMRYLLFAEGLPPGYVYTLGDKTLVAPAGSPYRFRWTVRRATSTGGIWRIREVDPTPFESSSEWERMAIAASQNAPVLLVCSQERLSRIEEEQEAAWKGFQDRCAEIRRKADQYASDLLKNIPGIPHKGSAFGAGTGTPTTTLEGAGLGALGGAILGGFFGGAGIGAGLGVVGGGLGGYLYSQERRREIYRRRLAAREAALREARKKIIAFRDGLIRGYEQELQERAREREGVLLRGEAAGFGEALRKD
ncbi:hypothetical protein MAMC_01672 [Methylacidimicrobium cyclopophantes]|uniref:Glycine zipper domain-containing protein n=1 Tax=Methylacidimicrobium cyclopophantes TaxID=1041766 RepID=A0A5E6MNF6_9BACT|nr:hypothetical protein [Methylacidimicrobium cyclopophantes]VVM07523.1 hypothetical protein MAMC_01672 [Methylacidimicrobium cyclopophantes]